MELLQKGPQLLSFIPHFSIPFLPLPARALPVLKAISAGITSLCQCQDTKSRFDLKQGQRTHLSKSPFHDLIFSSQPCHLNDSKNGCFTSDMVPVSLYKNLWLWSCLTILAALIHPSITHYVTYLLASCSITALRLTLYGL